MTDSAETAHFIIDLEYVAPMETVETLREAHMAFVERGYADGVFLSSGRKVPRTGGVIIAADRSRAAIEARMAVDPFVAEGAARCTIIEYVPSKAPATAVKA